MSDFQRPQGLQPSRLLHPWDFPGKNTGVGCHCLLQWVAGGLINGQAHPLRAEGRQRAQAPPGGAGGKGRFHLPPSFCVLGHCSLALDRVTRVYRQRGGVGNKGPPHSQHSWIQSGCGDELERLMGEDGKEAWLRTWSCFLNGVGGGVVGVSMKDWSRRVSCVDRMVNCVDRSVGV